VPGSVWSQDPGAIVGTDAEGFAPFKRGNKKNARVAFVDDLCVGDGGGVSAIIHRRRSIIVGATAALARARRRGRGLVCVAARLCSGGLAHTPPRRHDRFATRRRDVTIRSNDLIPL